MKLKRIWKIVLGLIVFFIIFVIGIIVFYSYSMSAVDKNDKTSVVFTVDAGSTSEIIADSLVSGKLIRNKYVFLIYLKLNKLCIKLKVL